MEGIIYMIFAMVWICIIAVICLVLLFVVCVFGLASGFFATAYQAKAVLQEAHRTEK
jgi:hypothetical protein